MLFRSELLFELELVLIFGDSEVEVGVGALVDGMRRVGSFDGHDRGRAVGPLCLANGLDAGHSKWKGDGEMGSCY